MYARIQWAGSGSNAICPGPVPSPGPRLGSAASARPLACGVRGRLPAFGRRAKLCRAWFPLWTRGGFSHVVSLSAANITEKREITDKEKEVAKTKEVAEKEKEVAEREEGAEKEVAEKEKKVAEREEVAEEKEVAERSCREGDC